MGVGLRCCFRNWVKIPKGPVVKSEPYYMHPLDNECKEIPMCLYYDPDYKDS